MQALHNSIDLVGEKKPLELQAYGCVLIVAEPRFSLYTSEVRSSVDKSTGLA
jgi:hypothetical protein